jgi:hypothetical protein
MVREVVVRWLAVLVLPCPKFTEHIRIIRLPETYRRRHTAFDCRWSGHNLVMVSYLSVCHSAWQGTRSGDTAPHCDSTSTILVVIGMLTSGRSASRYVFRDGLCI